MNLWLAVPAVVLVVWLWLTARSIGRVRAQLDAAESRLARRFYHLQSRVAEVDAVVRELDFERRRRNGEIRFVPETKLAEAIALHPRIGEILAGFGLAGSGCSGGGFDGDATLLDACRRASLDVRAVIAELDRFVRNPDAPVQVEPSTAKLYRLGRMS
jgi:hypothetical protein